MHCRTKTIPNCGKTETPPAENPFLRPGCRVQVIGNDGNLRKGIIPVKRAGRRKGTVVLKVTTSHARRPTKKDDSIINRLRRERKALVSEFEQIIDRWENERLRNLLLGYDPELHAKMDRIRNRLYEIEQQTKQLSNYGNVSVTRVVSVCCERLVQIAKPPTQETHASWIERRRTRINSITMELVRCTQPRYPDTRIRKRREMEETRRKPPEQRRGLDPKRALREFRRRTGRNVSSFAKMKRRYEILRND